MATEAYNFRKTPWWTFYGQPRSTYERILADFPPAYAIMMALAAGGAMLLQHLFNLGLARRDIPGAIYLEAFVFGPFFGLAAYYFAGWLFTVLAARVGGRGNMERNRTAWAWAFVPYLSGMVLLWIPLTIAAVARAQLHGHISPGVDRFLMNLEIFFYYAFVPFWAWSVYLLVVGLAVANRIRYRGAVMVLVTSYVLVGVAVWILYMLAHLFGLL